MTELFRKQAIDSAYNPDARGGVLQIMPPLAAVVFALLAALFVALVLVSTLGTADVYAVGRGVVRPAEPPLVVRAQTGGTIKSIDLARGARGAAGDVLVTFDVSAQVAQNAPCLAKLARQEEDLARLEQRLAAWSEQTAAREAGLALVLIAETRGAREKTNATREACDALAKTIERGRVTLPVDAVVDDVAVTVGSQIREGDVLASLVRAGSKLVSYVAVPEAHRAEVAVGKAVRLRFDALPFDSLGAGSGHVTGLLDALPPGVKIEGEGAVAYAEVSVDKMPAAAQPRMGMTFTADVFVRRARLYRILFGEPAQLD